MGNTPTPPPISMGPTKTEPENNPMRNYIIGSIVAVFLIVGSIGGGVYYFSGNGEAGTPVTEVPTELGEPVVDNIVEEVVVRVAKPIQGKDMRLDVSEEDYQPMMVLRVNYMEKHQVASVNYVGLDGDLENFSIFATVNDQGNLVGRLGECTGVVITDMLMDRRLSRKDKYCSLSVVCQEHMYDDCKDDRPSEEKATADTKQDNPPAGTDDVAKSDDAMTIAKSALAAAKTASDAAERAQKTADESLAVSQDNTGMLTQMIEHFGLMMSGEDVDKTIKDEGDEPKS